jgi:hypothetical protein
MENKTLTAVEWLVEQLIPEDQHEGIMDIIKEAKTKEREQIVKAYHRGLFSSMELEKPIVFGDEYYKETYKK